MKIILFLTIMSMIAGLAGCVTQIENTYHVTGNQNKFTVSDAVSATPNNKDLIDLAGSAYGDASTKQDERKK